jgi:hypothetical protein
MTFVLFSGETFYARGGWHDSPTLFDTLHEAIARGEERLAEPCHHDWYHVVNLRSGTIVAKSAEQAYGNH